MIEETNIKRKAGRPKDETYYTPEILAEAGKLESPSVVVQASKILEMLDKNRRGGEKAKYFKAWGVEDEDIKKDTYERELKSKLDRIIGLATKGISEKLRNTDKTNIAQLATVAGIFIDKSQLLETPKSLSRDKEIKGILKIDGESISPEIAAAIFDSPDLKNVGTILEQIKMYRKTLGSNKK